MSARTHVKAKASSAQGQSFMSPSAALARRSRAQGPQAAPHNGPRKISFSLDDMMRSPLQPLEGKNRPSTGQRASHSFGQVGVHREDAKSTAGGIGPSKRTDTLPEEEGQGAAPGAILKNTQSGGGGGGSGAAPAKPSLSLSGDSYTDTATESRKKIKFNVTVPSGLTAGDYALVNWIKGSMKQGDGTFFKVTMYGKTVDANFPSSQVDSVDEDPVYWSNSSGRWNYTTTSTGFYATDNPGPALSSEKGAVYALNFRIGLYKLADVPTTTSGTISATSIEEKPWQYSVAVASDGKFTHPAI